MCKQGTMRVSLPIETKRGVHLPQVRTHLNKGLAQICGRFSEGRQRSFSQVDIIQADIKSVYENQMGNFLKMFDCRIE